MKKYTAKYALWGLALNTLALSFSLPGCGGGSGPLDAGAGSAPPPSFKMVVNPGMQSVEQGSATKYTVTVTAENGFATSLTPTVSGLPAGASATFNPASVTPTSAGAMTTMTVTTTNAGAQSAPTPTGGSTLTVSVTSGGISRQATTSLVVTAPPAPGDLQGTIQ